MGYDPRTPARERTPFGNFQLRPTHLQTKVTRVPYADEHTDPGLLAAARQTVASRARDAADAALIMDALGLTADG